MRITYYVNAMILLEGAQSRVLCDPWVTFDNRSLSGLYNFPKVRASRDDIAAIKPDFIYITHTHADHYDPPTLALFPRTTPILVSWYEHNFTERAMRRLGFTDVRVADREKGLALNGDDHCWMEPSAVYPQVDSVGVFRLDGQMVVNANDVAFHQGQMRGIGERFSPIDLACIPYGYQGPYPAFYQNLSDSERAAESAKKRDRSYEQVLSFVDELKPRYLFPFAGGAVYGGAKAKLNPYYGVGTADGFLKFAKGRLNGAKPVLLSEGVTFDLSAEKVTGDWVERTYASEQAYVEDVARQPGPYDEGGVFWVAPSERVDLTKLLTQARAKQSAWQQRWKTKSEATYFLDVGDPKLYRLSLKDSQVTRVAEQDIADPVYEIFRVPYSLLIGLLTGHYNWSNVKTQHVWFYRKPNVFDSELHVLMSYLQL